MRESKKYSEKNYFNYLWIRNTRVNFQLYRIEYLNFWKLSSFIRNQARINIWLRTIKCSSLSRMKRRPRLRRELVELARFYTPPQDARSWSCSTHHLFPRPRQSHTPIIIPRPIKQLVFPRAFKDIKPRTNEETRDYSKNLNLWLFAALWIFFRALYKERRKKEGGREEKKRRNQTTED